MVAPCTGTTLGRLANGLSDSPVSLAVKSHLRRSRPVVLAVSTNDALGASMRNIALLKNTKNIYFVPMSQDDAVNKPNSLVADFTRIPDTIGRCHERHGSCSLSLYDAAAKIQVRKHSNLRGPRAPLV